MNITSHSTPFQECTSCQMCAAACPKDAISIRFNEDGFYRPYVDEDKCIDCGLCTKVCYKFDADIKMTTSGEADRIDVYSAQHLSDPILEKVTSGGVADALAKELIRQGYVCIGVVYNDDLHRAEHAVASSVAETDAFRGSKYIQSYSLDAFKTFVKNAKDTKFAIFGLPCHIYAAHKFLMLRRQRENCMLIDLFCHGCPSMLVWNKYEQAIKQQVGNKKFDEVQFRSKVKGWGTFYVVVVVVEGVKAFISSPKHDEFYSLFFSDHVLNDACSDCKLRSTMEYTDIRLGDFWGKRHLNDRKGVSAVAIMTERGRQLFSSVKGQFKTGESSMKEVVVKQSYGKVYSLNLELRRMMLDDLRNKEKSLSDVVDLFYSKQGVALKAKRLLKQINWYLPFDLTRLLKRIV